MIKQKELTKVEDIKEIKFSLDGTLISAEVLEWKVIKYDQDDDLEQLVRRRKPRRANFYLLGPQISLGRGRLYPDECRSWASDIFACSVLYLKRTK